MYVPTHMESSKFIELTAGQDHAPPHLTSGEHILWHFSQLFLHFSVIHALSPVTSA